MTQTICGIEIHKLTKRPTPQELAGIVAGWDDFFIALGESLRNCCAGKPFMQWQAIADTIKKTEEELCDGSASQFFREIQCRMEPDTTSILGWIGNEAARGLDEGIAIETLTAIKWKIKDTWHEIKATETQISTAAAIQGAKP